MDNFDEILELYQKVKKGEHKEQTLQYRQIIKIIHELSSNTDTEEIKNQLLLLLNLFFVNQPDHLHLQGKGLEELSLNEKTKVKSILQTEFA
ncbi:MAG: hypothetical protein ACOC44_19530 [Promethearchaeia archaeon]